jgi:hypothetical protein
MDLLAAAKPWTYWIAPLLMLGAVLGVAAVFVGYLVRVVAARYPRQ